MKQDDRYLTKIERFMKVRDMGLKVDDDATNIDKIADKGIISHGEADFLRDDY